MFFFSLSICLKFFDNLIKKKRSFQNFLVQLNAGGCAQSTHKKCESPFLQSLLYFDFSLFFFTLILAHLQTPFILYIFFPTLFFFLL